MGGWHGGMGGIRCLWVVWEGRGGWYGRIGEGGMGWYGRH